MERRDRVDELERYAMARHHKSDPESRGLCFQATLTLAEEARRLNLEERVGFVRWSVRRDQAFLEHWALVLDGAKVVDMTAVQVDGDANPLRRLADYPANPVRQLHQRRQKLQQQHRQLRPLLQKRYSPPPLPLLPPQPRRQKGKRRSSARSRSRPTGVPRPICASASSR